MDLRQGADHVWGSQVHLEPAELDQLRDLPQDDPRDAPGVSREDLALFRGKGTSREASQPRQDPRVWFSTIPISDSVKCVFPGRSRALTATKRTLSPRWLPWLHADLLPHRVPLSARRTCHSALVLLHPLVECWTTERQLR